MSNSTNKKITNIPSPLTSFVGRQKELANLKSLFKNTRLLTLTGIGGVGKTRLALHLAKEVLSGFEDGTWLVELAALTEPTLVEQSIAEAISLKEELNQPLISTLVNYLTSKKLLLILDNCEHLIEEIARLCQLLLNSCPDLKVLATSREAIGILGETTWQTPPLSLPAKTNLFELNSVRGKLFDDLIASEAVQLLVERARAVQPDFELMSQNSWAVAQICQDLDGIPLAIELAAARMRSLEVEQIALRLEDRFELLKNGNRSALPRQQTLSNLIDWSYNLLSEREKVILRRLSVFKDSFGLEAAAVIGCGTYSVITGQGLIEKGEVLDLISQLLNKSLLNLERTNTAQLHPEKSQPRYRLLETIRQYSWEKLVETGECEERGMLSKHLSWCLQMVEEAIPNLAGPQQKSWLALLELEHNNFRTALGWSISQMNVQVAKEIEVCDLKEKVDEEPNRSWPLSEMEMALRLSNKLAWFWDLHGYLSEGRRWLDQVLSEVRKHQGGTSFEIILLMAKALNAAGNLAQKQNDNDRAKALLEESLTLYRKLNEPNDLSKVLNNLGIVAFNQGDYTQAQIYYEESLAIKYRLGDKRSIGLTLTNMAELAHLKGETQRAISLFEEGLVLLKEAGDTQIVAIGLLNLGATIGEQGNYQRASQLLIESLKLFNELGDRFNIVESLERLAGFAGAVTMAEKAAHLFGAANALRQVISTPMSKNYLQSYEQAVLSVKKQIEPQIWEQHWLVGQQMKLEETIDFALTGFETQNIIQPSKLVVNRTLVSKDLDTMVVQTPPHLPPHPNILLSGLTGREEEVLKLIATGLTTKQMAAELNLSPLTVNAHLRSIYAKLGITSRSAATRIAIENNLV